MFTAYTENGIVKGSSDFNNTGWKDINSRIFRLSYQVEGKTYLLEGYEEYNHLVEFVQCINKKGSYVSKIAIMGAFKGITTIILFNLAIKDIEIYNIETGREYNGKPVTGWKWGMKAENPQYRIINNI